MATEIVDLPMKNGDVPVRKLLIHQRVVYFMGIVYLLIISHHIPNNSNILTNSIILLIISHYILANHILTNHILANHILTNHILANNILPNHILTNSNIPSYPQYIPTLPIFG